MLRIKVCGITRKSDAEKAVELGADALGFIFYPHSPRFIHPMDAWDIARKLPENITKVAVVVVPDPETVAFIKHDFNFDVLQIHGALTPEYLLCLRVYSIVPALQVGDDFSIDQIVKLKTSTGAFLLDTFKKGEYGGTGASFDWSQAYKAKQHARIILAGGLNPENINKAVETVKPYAVDLNSGVESSPGIKDHEKLQDIFHKLKEYRRDWQPDPPKAYPMA
ncbi:MAG: phosphoribosylanthranilate isomerase [Deferribacteres bacterium]|nr:phosphoribosylanthranilate isomerase [candidate division KSB1 bacterium]MCB9501813.1 phosphoribosylanthranilate isomerase [Deferribacteres bacterium]